MKKILIILGIVAGIGISLFAQPIPYPVTPGGTNTQIQINSSGVFGAIDNNSVSWNTAYAHSQDNTQAHSDYLLNTGDTATGNYVFNDGQVSITNTNDVNDTFVMRSNRTLTALKYDDAILSIYNQNILRTRILNGGQQFWYLHNIDNAEAGRIEYSTPSGYVGIICRGTDSNKLASFLNSNGSLVLGASTTGGVPKQVYIAPTGYIGINNSAPTKQIDALNTTGNSVIRSVGIANTNSSGSSVSVYENVAVDNASCGGDLYYDGGYNTLQLRTYSNSTTAVTRVTIGRDTGAIKIPAVYSTAVGATNLPVYCDNTGVIGYLSSSQKYKENIHDINDCSFIYDLRPREYDRIDGSAKNEKGLIAEEIAAVYPQAVVFKRKEILTKSELTETDGGAVINGIEYQMTDIPEAIDYTKLIVPMLKEIQEQKKLIDDLIKRIEILEKSK